MTRKQRNTVLVWSMHRHCGHGVAELERWLAAISEPDRRYLHQHGGAGRALEQERRVESLCADGWVATAKGEGWRLPYDDDPERDRTLGDELRDLFPADPHDDAVGLGRQVIPFPPTR